MENIFRHINLGKLHITKKMWAQYPFDFMPSFRTNDSRLSYEGLRIKPRKSLTMS